MSLTVSVEHLQSLKITFQDAIKVIDNLLGSVNEEEEVKKSPKKKASVTRTRTANVKKPEPREAIGKCGYCSSKIMKKMKTRAEYEEEPTRCGKAAHHLKDGVMLCDRHRENDIVKIIELLNSVVESEIDEEIDEIFVSIPPAEERDVDEIMSDVETIEKLLSDLSPQTCSLKAMPVMIAQYEDNKYVVSTNSVCYGKIRKDQTGEVDMSLRRKALCDIEGKLSPLQRSDISFLEKYKLSYIKYNL